MAFFFSSSTQCACARDLWRHRIEKKRVQIWLALFINGFQVWITAYLLEICFRQDSFIFLVVCVLCVCARLTSSVACCSCVRVRLSSPMRHTSFLHYHYAFVHCVSSVLPSTQWRRFLDEIKKQEVLETWMRSGPFGRAERVYECASECVYVFCSVNIEQEIIGYRHLQLTFMCTSYNDTLSDARTNAHGMRPNFGWVLSVCCSSSSRLYHR